MRIFRFLYHVVQPAETTQRDPSDRRETTETTKKWNQQKK